MVLLKKIYAPVTICLITLAFISCSSSSSLSKDIPAAESSAPSEDVRPEEMPVARPASMPKPAPFPVDIPEPVPIGMSEPAPDSPSLYPQDGTPPIARNRSLRHAQPAPEPSGASPDETDEGLRLGKVAWNTPESIRVSETAKIEVRVTLDPERFAGLPQRIRSEGNVQTDEANFSNDLTATLVASKEVIDIDPPEPQRQNVFKGRDAQWVWTIYPKQPGTHTLILTIKSHIGDKVTSESFSHEILVEALPPPPPPSGWDKTLDFLKSDWEAVVTIILLPLAGWLYRIYAMRRKEKG